MWSNCSILEEVQTVTIDLLLSAALQDGNTGRTKAEIFTRTEGENLTVPCFFKSSVGRKSFCKETCKNETLLIETSDVRAQRGRYSITHEEGSFSFSVSITQLKESDSGLYSCALGRDSSPASSTQFEIIVVDGEFLLKTTCLWSVKKNITLSELHI